jgi:hypothetical protein
VFTNTQSGSANIRSIHNASRVLFLVLNMLRMGRIWR